MKSKKTLILIFSLCVVASLFFEGKTSGLRNHNALSQSSLSCFLPTQFDVHPKMSSALGRLAEIYRTQGSEALSAFAGLKGIELRSGKVQVVVESAVSNLERKLCGRARILENMIQGKGGVVETGYDQYTQCWIPVSALDQLADNPVIQVIRMPLRPWPAETSEGVNKIGADAWKNLPSFHSGGRRVKVCIFDTGFKGYKSLLGTDLPAQVTAKSFRADGNIETSLHGTCCAEIVYDICPDAEFYLVNYGTSIEHHQAVDWIISQGIDVVSHSIGWFNAGDGKGTGPLNEDIKRAVQSGVIWVNAAGNEADDHWIGSFNDPDGDGWHEFAEGEEIFEFTHQYESVFLNWDDWGAWTGSSYPGSTEDYDLYLYYWNGTAWILKDISADIQNGCPGQEPIEDISGWYDENAAVKWGVAIRKKSSVRNCQLELFIRLHEEPLKYNMPGSSLRIGADSPYAVAVGALPWWEDSILPDSAQGPTKDGRIKPEYCAPTGVTTRTGGRGGFGQTSGATPHVSGAFALLLGKTSFSKEQVRKIISLRALDLGAPGPDNIYGYFGRLNLLKSPNINFAGH